MPPCRAPFRSTAVLLALATASCGRPAPPPTPPTVPTPTPETASAPVAATADAEVTATVDQVLTSATHPGLQWSSIPDVAPALKPLYDAEADRLLWFDGARPGAQLEGTLATVAAATAHGLEPRDYDAATLAEQWKTLKAGGGSGPERALFDLALSIGAARMLKAVNVGRVDPATMLWGYDIAAKKLDLTAALRDARQGGGLADALEALQPPFTHYRRARRMAAIYRDLAKAGEPPAVPALGTGVRKVEPGTTWTGVPQLAARLRRVRRSARPCRDLPRPIHRSTAARSSRRSSASSGATAWRPTASSAPAPFARSTCRWPSRSARSSCRWSGCAGCRR